MPGEPREWPEYPFCSKRCKTIDLGRWLGESYAITAADQEPEQIDPEEEPAEDS
jgi:uncharacterized protein